MSHAKAANTKSRATFHAPTPRARIAALGGVVALLVGATGCATNTGPPPRINAENFIEREVDAGLLLYRGGDFVLAAGRLSAAADEAQRCGQPALEADIRSGECAAWLRGGSVSEFRTCTGRLQTLQREVGRSDPGVNTLIALGAIARGEPLPPYRLPNSVRRLLQTTAAGGA